MKHLLLVIFCLSAAMPAFATINRFHAANKLVGDYRLETKTDDDVIEFTIEKGDKISITKWGVDTFETGGNPPSRYQLITLDSLTNGPEALPVAAIVLQNGSDEETTSYQLRISIIQEDAKTSNLVLLDTLRTTNEGPNSFTAISSPKSRLLKKVGARYEVVSPLKK